MKGSKLDSTLKYQHFAKVTIKSFSGFPIDMLRYDRCMPYQEVDSSWIGEAGMLSREIVVVVVQYSERQTCSWTEERWKSFGAKIEPIAQSGIQAVRHRQEELSKQPN